MKKFLCLLLLVLMARVSSAQAVIVGPNSKLAWTISAPTLTLALAQGFTYTITVDAATPVALTSVACVAGTGTGVFACTAPLGQVATGSHSITMTATSGTIVSSPSSAFAYIDLLIPIPTGLGLTP